MTQLPMWMDCLTPEIEKIAKEELGETKEVRIQALKDMRRLINGENDFRPLMDDVFLLKFLRTKKFNAEKAFNTLKNFYTFKVRYSGIITDIKPSQLMEVYEMNNMALLSKRLENGSAVGILRAGHFQIDSGPPEDLFAACLIAVEVALESTATQVCGGTAILDLDKFGLRHMRHFGSPTFLYRLIRLVQDCVPIRIKGIHIINEPLFFSLIFNIVKPFLSEKIKNRIFFHGSSLKSLHKYIPAEILPEELNGKLGPIDNSELRHRLQNREGYFEKTMKYGFQEKRAQFIRKKSSRALGLFI